MTQHGACIPRKVPLDPRVTIRPMFGNVAAFVGEQMFEDLFGNGVFVRLDDAARPELLAEPGAGPFEPMKGRPIREYVTLPPMWRNRPERARAWVDRSVAWAAKLPAKRSGRSRKVPKATRRRRCPVGVVCSTKQGEDELSSRRRVAGAARILTGRRRTHILAHPAIPAKFGRRETRSGGRGLVAFTASRGSARMRPSSK